MAPDNEKKTVVTSSRYSKILVVIAMLVIIAMILSTATIIASKNKQSNMVLHLINESSDAPSIYKTFQM